MSLASSHSSTSSFWNDRNTPDYDLNHLDSIELLQAHDFWKSLIKLFPRDIKKLRSSWAKGVIIPVQGGIKDANFDKRFSDLLTNLEKYRWIIESLGSSENECKLKELDQVQVNLTLDKGKINVAERGQNENDCHQITLDEINNKITHPLWKKSTPEERVQNPAFPPASLPNPLLLPQPSQGPALDFSKFHKPRPTAAPEVTKPGKIPPRYLTLLDGYSNFPKHSTSFSQYVSQEPQNGSFELVMMVIASASLLALVFLALYRNLFADIVEGYRRKHKVQRKNRLRDAIEIV